MNALYLTGAAVTVLSGFLWGIEKSRKEKRKLLILEGLLSFVTYTEEHISHFKTPLGKIFSDFENSELRECGFLAVLCSSGAASAVETLHGKIADEAYTEMIKFSKGLGGSYEQGQIDLCRFTRQRLAESVESIRKNMPQKLRMYRMLPVLAALSAVILLV